MNMNERLVPGAGSKRQSLLVLYFTCAVTLIGVLLLDLSIPLGVAVGVLYIGVVLLTLWIPQSKATFVVVIVSSL